MDASKVFRDICQGGNLKLAVSCGLPMREVLRFCLSSDVDMVSAQACQLAHPSDFETPEGHLLAGCSNSALLRFFLEFQEWTPELQSSWEPSVLKKAMSVSVPILTTMDLPILDLIELDELDSSALELVSNMDLFPSVLLKLLKRFRFCQIHLPAYFELVSRHFRTLIRPFLRRICHPDLFLATEKDENWPEQRFMMNQTLRVIFGKSFLEEERAGVLVKALKESSLVIQAYLLGLMPDQGSSVSNKLTELQGQSWKQYAVSVKLFSPSGDMKHDENLSMEPLNRYHPFDVMVFQGYGYTRDEWSKLLEDGKCFYTRRELSLEFKMQLMNRIVMASALPPLRPYLELVQEFGFTPLPEFYRPKRVSPKRSVERIPGSRSFPHRRFAHLARSGHRRTRSQTDDGT